MAAFQKKNKVVDPTQCPSGIDTSTYFTPSIPDEIREIIPLFHSATISLEAVQKIIDVAIDYLQKNLNEIVIDNSLYENGLEVDLTDKLLTGIYLILQTAMRRKIKISKINEDLVKMNIPTSIVDYLCTKITENRVDFEYHVLHNRVQFAQLESLRWRVDVIISSGSLTRVMRPHILIQMVMKDGSVQTFEVTIEQFSQLRYNVAKVLHDMQTLERHPIIRIVNEFKRKDEEEYNK